MWSAEENENADGVTRIACYAIQLVLVVLPLIVEWVLLNGYVPRMP